MAHLDVVVSLSSSAAANRRLYALAALLCFAAIAEGQVSPGRPSFAAQDCGQYDCINLQNLNVSLHVPVMSKNGAFPFNVALAGGNSYVYYNGTSLQPGILVAPLTPSINGVLSPFGYAKVLAATTTSVTCPAGDGSGQASMYSGFYLQFPDGTQHNLPPGDVAYGGATCSSTLTDQVVDGTGWTLTINGGTFYSSGQAGVTIVSSGGMLVSSVLNSTYMQDAQSTPNKISYAISQQTYTDTLGTEVLTVNANAAGQLAWFDVAGGYPTESQTLASSTLKTSFGCPGIPDYPATGGTYLTTAVSFPDSTNLALSWEPNQVTNTDYTGRLAKITLRNGSSIVQFNYNPANLGSSNHYNLNCTYLVPNSMTRTTSDGTVSYTLAYITEPGGPGYNYTFTGITDTKIDIGGNKTIYTFAPYPDPAGGYVGGLIPAPV